MQRVTHIHDSGNDNGDTDNKSNNGNKANGITVNLCYSMWLFHGFGFYKNEFILKGKT
jgi:hypothetical protein